MAEQKERNISRLSLLQIEPREVETSSALKENDFFKSVLSFIYEAITALTGPYGKLYGEDPHIMQKSSMYGALSSSAIQLISSPLAQCALNVRSDTLAPDNTDNPLTGMMILHSLQQLLFQYEALNSALKYLESIVNDLSSVSDTSDDARAPTVRGHHCLLARASSPTVAESGKIRSDSPDSIDLSETCTVPSLHEWQEQIRVLCEKLHKLKLMLKHNMLKHDLLSVNAADGKDSADKISLRRQYERSWEVTKKEFIVKLRSKLKKATSNHDRERSEWALKLHQQEVSATQLIAERNKLMTALSVGTKSLDAVTSQYKELKTRYDDLQSQKTHIKSDLNQEETNNNALIQSEYMQRLLLSAYSEREKLESELQELRRRF